MFKAWSYSRLTIFEQCKLRAKLAYIDRIPEPPRPLPPGKTEHANDRGSRIHEAAELYVKGGVELVTELQLFQAEFKALRAWYTAGGVSLEGEWAVNRDWMPVGWNSQDVWARVKLDAMVMIEPTHALVIDYKTGKKNGNEIKHGEQAQLYQLATFLRYPELERVTTELWYTDLDDITRMSYTRDQGMRFFPGFDKRGELMTSCEDFKANPNMFSCRWCPYGPRGTGHCTVGL